MGNASLLDKNLSALAKVDKLLATRIAWPVDHRHVVETQGKRFLQVHNLKVPLEVTPAECNAVSLTTPEVLVFGIGQGEIVEYLLKTHKQLRVTAWERDAWMMRVALGRNDFARALAQGRLVLKMGVDLLSYVPAQLPVLEHPRLAPAYTLERTLLHPPSTEKRALLCSGALFVEDVAEALREEGFCVFPLEVHKLSPEELTYVMQVAKPTKVVSINYTPGLAEFLAPYQTKLLVWEIDPAIDVLPKVASSSQHVRMFTYRQAHVPEFQKLGFQHAEYLPLATNPRRRAPATLSQEETEKYSAKVSFVGSSMALLAQNYRRQFCEAYAVWKKNPEAFAQAEQCLQDALDDQRQDFSNFQLMGLLEASMGDFLRATRQPGKVDARMLAAEVGASEKRLHYVQALGAFGVSVWGDEGWKTLQAPGCVYQGHAGHYVELNKIYSQSLINLDIGRLYQPDIVTMRVFDVLACGGFVLAEHSSALEELFRVGEELDSYRTLSEMIDKVSYYVSHPEKARAIALKGREAVLQRHTIRMRVQHMLQTA